MAAPFLTFRGIGAATALDDVAPAGGFAAETLRRLAGGDAEPFDGVFARPAKRARTDVGPTDGGATPLANVDAAAGSSCDPRLGRIDGDGLFTPSAPPSSSAPDSPLFRFVDHYVKVPLDWGASGPAAASR